MAYLASGLWMILVIIMMIVFLILGLDYLAPALSDLLHALET